MFQIICCMATTIDFRSVLLSKQWKIPKLCTIWNQFRDWRHFLTCSTGYPCLELVKWPRRCSSPIISFVGLGFRFRLMVRGKGFCRPVARIDLGGCRTPKSGPFGPKKWTFWTSPPLILLQKTHFWPILWLKVDLLGDLGWCVAPPHPPWLRAWVFGFIG